MKGQLYMKNTKKFDLVNNLELSNEDISYFNEQEKISNIIIKLVARRIELNMTQRELEKKSGVKQPMIARIERFDSIPRLDTLIKLANALDLDLSFDDKNFDNVVTIEILFSISNKNQEVSGNSFTINNNNIFMGNDYPSAIA